MLDWSQCPAVERDPERLSGAWVFRGTRVPVAALFENLESGASLDEFLEWFPGVTREKAEGVLEHAARSLLVETGTSRFPVFEVPTDAPMIPASRVQKALDEEDTV